MFNGTFDGRGYTISNLTVNARMWTNSRCGMFKNVAFVNLTQTSVASGFLR